MKIGILTFHSVSNFGANLQAYATFKTLKELNHEVKIIDYFPDHFEKQNIEIENKDQIKAHKDFVKKNATLTNLCQDEDQLISVCREEKFDHIMIGSDAVFLINNKNTFWRFPNPFWGGWIFENDELRNTKVSSLAASSMGTPFLTLNGKTKKSIIENVKRFHKITVRDQWTKGNFKLMIKRSKDILICPDPVSSLKKEDIEAISNFKPNRPRPYILFSASKGFFELNWINALIVEAHGHNIDVGLLPTPECKIEGDFDFYVDYPLSPSDWFLWITNSCGYVGMRFHPIVVSLFNGIPFISFDHYVRKYFKLFRIKRSSKTYDLCKRNHYLDNWFDLNKSIPDPKLIINRLLESKRNTSILEFSKEKFYENVTEILS